MKQEATDPGVAPPEMAYTPTRHDDAPAGIFLPAVASQRSSTHADDYARAVPVHAAYPADYSAQYQPPSNYQYQYPPQADMGTYQPYDTYGAPYDKQHWQDHSRLVTEDQLTPRSFAPSYDGHGAPLSPHPQQYQYPISPTHSHYSKSGPIQSPKRNSIPQQQRMSRSSAGSAAGSPSVAPARASVSRTHPRPTEPSHSRSSVHSRSTGTVVQTEAAIYTRSLDEEEEDHAGWVMICLALFTPFYSLFFALYALFSTFFILLLRSPFRLCFPSVPLADEFAQLLCPAITAHLKIVYSTELTNFTSPLSHSQTTNSSSNHSSAKKHSSRRSKPTWRLKSGLAVVVLIGAPIVAVPIALATWVAGTFWLFTAVLGNPDGRGRRDDGRVAILGVRRAWERWILGCICLG